MEVVLNKMFELMAFDPIYGDADDSDDDDSDDDDDSEKDDDDSDEDGSDEDDSDDDDDDDDRDERRTTCEEEEGAKEAADNQFDDSE